MRLRVEDWTDSDENEPPPREKEPPAKRKRLSLPKKGRDNGPSFLSIAEEAALSEKCVPKNTAISTKWAVSNFECWRKRRNETFNLEPERQVPDGLLLGHDSAALCKWLSVYVAEARKQDGSPFPPKSLYVLLTGLLRHMRSKNPTCPNFLETNQLEFVSLHNAMDNVFRKLHVEGVQAESRSMEAFNKEEIGHLWGSGSLSTKTPKGLLRAVFFNNGISFCLRGGGGGRSTVTRGSAS